jgi:hypothetical protein
MSEPIAHSPNVFNANEEPRLNEAFAIAWRALTAQQDDPKSRGDQDSIALQSRIASAIMAVASEGVIDPAQMAKAAIERCASSDGRAAAIGGAVPQTLIPKGPTAPRAQGPAEAL